MRSKIINMVGRKENRSFVVKPTDDALTSPLRNKIKQDTASIDINFDNNLAPLSPDSDKRRRVQNSDGETFVEMMSTSTATVFVNESPQHEAANRKIQFSKSRIGLFQPHDTEYFEFTVTADVINRRLGKKRPCSQKKAMGCTAAEFLAECGAIIVSKVNKIAGYHLAHRQGWAIGGSQKARNLDASTAGSNYSTLFTIESPLVHIIIEDNVAAIKVSGVVHYHPKVPIPCEIIYNLSWGNGRSAKVSTFPLNHRIPTIDEHIVAKAVLSATRTPSKKRKAPVDDPDEVGSMNNFNI
jgi:hypothetical protein